MDLPCEILVHIFQYLSESDQRAASLTCKDWYNAASYHFLKKVVKFDGIPLNDDASCPLQIFTNSTIKYRKYLFQKVKITAETLYFWREANIRCLTLEGCDITQDMLLCILRTCPNIQELIIDKLQNFTSGCLEKTVCLEELKLLTVHKNGYFGNKTLLFIKYIKAPALEVLNIHPCATPFDVILDFIKSTAKTLKKISMYGGFTAEQLKELVAVKELRLQSLFLRGETLLYYDSSALEALLNHQTSLKELNCNSSFQIYDESLVHLCNQLINLESLNINATVTDVGIISLKKLKLLKSLKLNCCINVTKYGLQHGICSEFNKTLEVLDIAWTNLREDGLLLLSERLSLRFLDVTGCDGVTDTSMKAIIRNQVHLHTLRMACTPVSDVGLTDSLCSIRNLKFLRELDISNCWLITDVTLSAFNFKDLYKLNMSGCRVTSSGLQDLVQGCPNIEYILMTDCPELKKEEIVVRGILKGLRRLKRFQL